MKWLKDAIIIIIVVSEDLNSLWIKVVQFLQTDKPISNTFVQSMPIRLLIMLILLRINYGQFRITWNYIYQGMYLADAKLLTLHSRDMRLTGSYAFPYEVLISYMYADLPNCKFVVTVAMRNACVRFPGNSITDVWVYMHYNVRCFGQQKYNLVCIQPFLMLFRVQKPHKVALAHKSYKHVITFLTSNLL